MPLCASADDIPADAKQLLDAVRGLWAEASTLDALTQKLGGKPIQGGDPWAALLDTLARHDHARALVWGHVHQASDRQRGHVRLLSTPSTCAQFTPHTERCVMDTRPPGFRRLDLYPDGEVRTHVHWLEEWSLAQRPPDSRAPP
jgi:hypothetical protein